MFPIRGVANEPNSKTQLPPENSLWISIPNYEL
jgi:hypothetical protein